MWNGAAHAPGVHGFCYLRRNVFGLEAPIAPICWLCCNDIPKAFFESGVENSTVSLETSYLVRREDAHKPSGSFARLTMSLIVSSQTECNKIEAS